MSYTMTDADDEPVELHIWGAGDGTLGVRLRLTRLNTGNVTLSGRFDADVLHRAGFGFDRGASAAAADERRIVELELVIDDVLAAFDDGRNQFITTANAAATSVQRDRLAHWAAIRRGLPAVESEPVASNETPPPAVPSNGTEQQYADVTDDEIVLIALGQAMIARAASGVSWDRAASVAARTASDSGKPLLLAFNGELVPVAPFDSPAAITVRWDNLRHVRRG